MRTLSSREAGRLLHLNVKQIQRLARSGKLPASRVGRKWLFDEDQIERLLHREPPGPARLDISARNCLKGRVVRLVSDGLMAEVVLRIGDQDLVAVITRSSAERMRLKAGDDAYAIVKSTEVMIGREGYAT